MEEAELGFELRSVCPEAHFNLLANSLHGGRWWRRVGKNFPPGKELALGTPESGVRLADPPSAKISLLSLLLRLAISPGLSSHLMGTRSACSCLGPHPFGAPTSVPACSPLRGELSRRSGRPGCPSFMHLRQAGQSGPNYQSLSCHVC